MLNKSGDILKAVIRDVEFYVPINVVDNEHFIKHYKEKYNKDVTHILENMGRKKRRICNDDETIITMAVKSINSILYKNNLNINDIDVIVFASGTPEYIQPCNAVKLHHLLGCKEKTMIYDINSSCVGLVVALTQVESIMRNNTDIEYAIIVGAEQVNHFSRDEEPISFITSGESACSILLENTETTDRGLIDYNYHVNSTLHDKILFPQKGFRYAIDKDTKNKYNFIAWKPFSVNLIFDIAIKSINELLDKNNIDKSKIKKYFLSQVNKTGLNIVSKALEEPIDKFKYIGDTYGYTGVTSPFIALKHSLEEGEVKKGDYIIIWSIGSGITCHGNIFKL